MNVVIIKNNIDIDRSEFDYVIKHKEESPEELVTQIKNKNSQNTLLISEANIKFQFTLSSELLKNGYSVEKFIA